MRALVVGTALIAVVVLLGCGQPDLRSSGILGGVPIDVYEYTSAAIDGLDEAWSVEQHNYVKDFVVGDFMGDLSSEIAVMFQDVVEIYDLTGQKRDEFVPADGSLEPAFADDVDEDGKDDLVFGGRRSGSARIVITRGDGSVVRDVAIQAMFEADTHPRFYADGKVYFDAASRVHVSPKLVGVYEVQADTTTWTTSIAGVPTGLSLGGDGMVAVSSFAVTRDRSDAEFPLAYDGSHAQNGLVVLNSQGELVISEPIGPEAVDGDIVEQGVARLDAYIVDSPGNRPAGAPAFLTVAQRFSDLYRGPTELALRESSGDLIARFLGEPETQAEVALFHLGDELRILVAFDRSGRFVLLDDELTVLSEFTGSDPPHRAGIASVGDYDGDGRPEFLVRDGRVLMLLSEDLELEWETAFDVAVEKAVALPTENGDLVLVVAAGGLYVLTQHDEPKGRLVLFSEPAGADFYIDGTKVAPRDLPVVGSLMPGTHEVFAEFPGLAGADGNAVNATYTVEVVPGQVTELVATFDGLPVSYQPGTPTTVCESTLVSDFARLELLAEKQVPSWYAVPYVGDYLPDDGLELGFLDKTASRLAVYNAELVLRRDVRFSRVADFSAYFVDVDGDGYQDYYAGHGDSEKGLWAATVDGRIIFDKSLLYGNDMAVRIVPPAWFAGRLYAVLQTNYLRGPDAVVGLDPPAMSTAYLYPIPAQGLTSIARDDRLYLSMYTASNGNEFVYSDGTAVNDAEVFVNVMTVDGEKHPHSRHYEGDPQGGLVFFEFDTNNDGETEVYFRRDHDPNYNTGTGGVFRMGEDGQITKLWEARENDSHHVYPIQTGEGPRIVVIGRLTDRLTILDGGFKVLVDMPRDGNPYSAPADRDMDGTIDYRSVEGTDVVIRSIDGTELFRFPSPRDSVGRVVEADIDCDGTREFIVTYEGVLQLWGNR